MEPNFLLHLHQRSVLTEEHTHKYLFAVSPKIKTRQTRRVIDWLIGVDRIWDQTTSWPSQGATLRRNWRTQTELHFVIEEKINLSATTKRRFTVTPQQSVIYSHLFHSGLLLLLLHAKWKSTAKRIIRVSINQVKDTTTTSGRVRNAVNAPHHSTAALN